MAMLKPNLLVVAHPDDEAIFFGGLVLRERRVPWHLVCVTDGNADGRGPQRHADLLKAAKALKINMVEHWDFPDRFNERLDTDQLVNRLRKLPSSKTVFTHSILGDYGHPHHQDVSYAVHKAFHKRTPVWSVAYNCLPEKRFHLTKAELRLKQKILTEIYQQETQRFIHLLPAQSTEGFVQVSLSEAEHLYKVLRFREPLVPAKLKIYRWLARQLPQTAYGGMERPF
jgi:LmbE family N-acetylglucosaminyl deacetylase